jgi:hypothetical protein
MATPIRLGASPFVDSVFGAAGTVHCLNARVGGGLAAAECLYKKPAGSLRINCVGSYLINSKVGDLEADVGHKARPGPSFRLAQSPTRLSGLLGFASNA